jgi:hypothetical protein
VKISKVCSVIIGLLLILSLNTYSATINVPADQPTIQAGINASSDGDIILVAPGVYDELIIFPGHSVILMSEQGPEVTFIESSAKKEIVDSASYFDNHKELPDTLSRTVKGYDLISLTSAASGSVIDGFTFRNADNIDNVIFVTGTVSTISIINNFFYDLNAYDIIRATDNASVQVSRNIFSNSATGNIIVTTSPDCSFINNTVDGGHRGLAIYGSNSTILNNIVINIGEYAIMEPAPSTYVDYNDFWQNGYNNNPGPNGISQDPLFVNPSIDDYSLNTNSPCRDAGHPDPQYNDPDGTRNDMGANYIFTHLPIAIDINMLPDQMENVVNHAPTFYWTYYDVSGNQVAYQIEVSADNDWTVVESWNTGEIYSNDEFAVYGGEELLDNHTYYLRIRLFNGSTWGRWTYHVFHMNAIPEPPILFYPINQIYVSYLHVQLFVYNSYDPDNEYLTYDYEIYDDPGMTSLIKSVVYIPQGQDITGSGLITDLVIDTEYWWRARAYDLLEFSEWSELQSFIVREAGIINIPSDYTTIQEGILAAQTGDSIIVAPGYYYENMNFLGKEVVVKSDGGRDVTFIDPQNPNIAIVTFENEENYNTILDGFTIRNTNDAYGILCHNSSPIIQNCDISNCNHNGDGAGIFCRNSFAIIRYNTIHNNHGTKTGGGISGTGTPGPEISFNEIYSNISPHGQGIGFFGPSSGINIHHNIIRDNSGNGYGAIYINGSECDIINNTIVNNNNGIDILNGSGINIFNNIVTNNDGAGIIPSQAIYDYNNVWNNNSHNQPGPNGISENPVFIDSANNDFGLHANSPCINTGHPDPVYNDPDGSRNDMGALYFAMQLPVAIDINLGIEDQNHVVNHTPTFHWTFYDLTGTQVAYQIEIGTDVDWSIAESWNTGVVYTSVENAQYAGTSLEDGQEYYLRIQLFNGIDWGDWIEYSFRMNSLPEAPVPVEPSDGEFVHLYKVELTVANSLDSENDDKTYSFEIYSDHGLSNIVYSADEIIEQDVVTTCEVDNGLDANETYWWRARASDGYEYSEWSITQSFSTIGSKVIKVPKEYLTIQSAINVALYGDTVQVDAGLYVENIDFLGKSIYLKGMGGPHLTIVKASNPADNVIAMISEEEAISTIEGFSVIGGESDYVIEIVNTFLTIKSCIFYDNSPDREVISLISSRAIITRNLFYNNGGISCVGLRSGSEETRIINNTFDRNARGFFSICNGGFAINNIVTNSEEYGIYGSFARQDYNNVYNNGDDYDGGAHPGPNNLSQDPIYFNELNNIYILRDNSPCIDTGDPDPEYNDPDGSRNDIGAYPYSVSPPGEFSLLDFEMTYDGIVYTMLPTFRWTMAQDPDLGDNVYYTLYVAMDDDFTFIHTVDDLEQLSYTMEDSLDFAKEYWWRVSARDNTNYTIFSSDTKYFTTWRLGDINHNWVYDILDLTLMIDFKFKGGPPPVPYYSGDVNRNCTVDLLDIVHMIDNKFKDGPEPLPGCAENQPKSSQPSQIQQVEQSNKTPERKK